MNGVFKAKLELQIHWQFKDGHTEMVSQRQIGSSVGLEDWVDEIKINFPLPSGAQWMICDERSEFFVRSDKRGGTLNG